MGFFVLELQLQIRQDQRDQLYQSEFQSQFLPAHLRDFKNYLPTYGIQVGSRGGRVFVIGEGGV
jgi:hypothetical protein